MKKTGIFFIREGTDYNLEYDHAETMVPDPELIESYICFFTEYLLPEYTYSKEESIQILQKMQSELQSQCESQ